MGESAIDARKEGDDHRGSRWRLWLRRASAMGDKRVRMESAFLNLTASASQSALGVSRPTREEMTGDHTHNTTIELPSAQERNGIRDAIWERKAKEMKR